MIDETQIKRYESPRDLTERLEQLGVVFELDSTGWSFEICSYALDEAGEFVPIQPATLEEIRESKSAILKELRCRRNALIRATDAWLKHDPEYCAQFGDSK